VGGGRRQMAAACTGHRRRTNSFKGGDARVPRAGRRRPAEGREEAWTGLSMVEKEASGGGEGGGGQCRSSIELCGQHSLFF
jgi:hypothetical protein